MTGLVLGGLTLLGTSVAVAGEGIRVGNIAEVDLDAVNRIIDESDDAVPPEPSRRRLLSLEQALELALARNLDLEITALELYASEPTVDAAKAKFDPTPGFNAGASGRKIDLSGLLDDEEIDRQNVTAFVRQEVPTGGSLRLSAGYARDRSAETVDAPGGPFVDRNTQEIAGFGIEVRQPLLRGGRTYVARRNIAEAEFDVEGREADLRGQILSVTADTKDAYYRAILAGRLIEVMDEAIARDKSLIERSQALFGGGYLTKRDVLSAELRLASDEGTRATRVAQSELAQYRLREILGVPMDVQIDLAENDIPFRPIEIKLDRWLQSALTHRPELQRIQTLLERSELELRIRKNATLPNLDVVGAYQNDVKFKSYEWRAGLAFEIPVGNVASRSLLTRAQAEHTRIEREYLREQRLIEKQVRDLEVRLRANVERLKSLTTQVQKAREKREVAEARFELGLANNLDITDADAEIVLAESQLLEAVVDYASSLAFLEASIAGPL